MGRTPVEVATMKKHHRASLEWPSWLGDPPFKCQSWRPTAPPSLQSITVSGVLSTSPCFCLQSEIRYIYGFLDHRQLMQNVSKIQFEMEIRIWADLIWILLIQQCIQMIFSFAGPNPKCLYKSLYIISTSDFHLQTSDVDISTFDSLFEIFFLIMKTQKCSANSQKLRFNLIFSGVPNIYTQHIFH